MKFNYSIITAGFLLLFSSCGEDFLDTKPITTKTDASYYLTTSDAMEALTGCYDGLQIIYSNGTALPLASDVMSDQCFGGTGAGDGEGWPMMDEFDLSVSPGDMNVFLGNWQSSYKAIYRCNMLLGRLYQVDWGNTPELAKEIEAEARFIRAYVYFDLVRMFGRIPLLTEPSIDNIPQSEPDKVYQLIVEDLLFSIENGNKNKYQQIQSTEYGHINKWAAEALMARVYLFYSGYYGKPDLLGLVSNAQALGYVEDIIANSGHDLIDNYSDLWPAAATYEAAKAGKPITENTYAGETNKEIVFAIKYTYTSDWNGNTDGNHWLVMNGLRSSFWGPSGYGLGWGACTVVPSLYTNWDANDIRREASIMAIDEEGITFDPVDAKEYTGYYTKKYTPTCDSLGKSIAEKLGGVSFMISQYQDYFVVRYSDVLLMAAELGSSNALAYVNQVRERSNATPVTAVNKDVIFEERRLEFAFEGIRYWDLLRYDASLNYAANKISYSGTVKTAGVNVPKSIDKNNFLTTKGLFQVPNDQITLSNGVLKQNPGW